MNSKLTQLLLALGLVAATTVACGPSDTTDPTPDDAAPDTEETAPAPAEGGAEGGEGGEG